LFKVPNEFKVGVLATIAILLLVLGYNLMRGKNILSSEKIVYARYSSVGGLALAGHVRYNGMNVGRVLGMELADDGTGDIIVSMNVAPDLKIPKGSIARIVQIDLFGTKALQIELSDQKEYLSSGDTLISAREEDVIDAVKTKALSLLSSLDTVVISVKKTFNDETEDNLRKSFASIQRSLNTLDQTLDKNSNRLDKIFLNIESITSNLEQNKEQITSILTNLNEITDTLKRAQFAETITQARDVLQHTSEVMEKINNSQGSMGMLVNDPKLYASLDSSAQSLDALLKDMKAHPSRYVQVSVFGKKDKSSSSTPKQ
jgi:phospholipid/cholesterol/gamma-HCH transport system substrate-binding protein